MTPENAARYADLVAELGALLAASYGDEALSDDRVEITTEDLNNAINDALPTPVF